jgi:gliding-associated putative ABC transporter substrate-binding component GldG
MLARKSIDRAVQTVAVLGSLVFVNILSVRYFDRLDLTRDGQFTLSEATKKTVSELADPVTVRAYFTKDLPPPFSTNARYVRDLLEEYYAHSNGTVQYEFIDPASTETAEDRQKKKEAQRDIFGRLVRERTSIEQELQSLGIPSVQVHVNEGDKLEVKRAYMGIAIRYGDDAEVIPMVQDTRGLEYDLTTLVRKLTRERTPKIALLGGHEGPDLQKDLAQAFGLMSQLYEVATLDLTEKAEIPDDVDAVLVVGPKTPLGEDEQRELDRFITSGKAVAFLLDVAKPDLETLRAEDADHGLTDLLSSYGVRIGPGLVLDAECATINVTQQQGFMRIMQPVRYPFVPQPRGLDPMHPLTRGLSQVAFPFMAPLDITVADDGDVRAEVLVQSSERSWIQSPPFNLNPFQRWTLDGAGASPRNLVVALSGPISSHFMLESTEAEQSRPNGRVLVAGGSSFLADQFLSKGNQTLVLNLVDWLVLDDALLSMRSRGLRAAPLEDVDKATRDLIKYTNVLGLPLAFIVFGLGRWRVRERRRGQVRL